MYKITYKDGRVEEYSSIREASKETGLPYNSLVAWFNGTNEGYKLRGIIKLERSEHKNTAQSLEDIQHTLDLCLEYLEKLVDKSLDKEV